MDRDIEKYCIDGKGHEPIDYFDFIKCEKCGMTWFYTNGNNPTKADNGKPAQSFREEQRQKYRD